MTPRERDRDTAQRDSLPPPLGSTPLATFAEPVVATVSLGAGAESASEATASDLPAEAALSLRCLACAYSWASAIDVRCPRCGASDAGGTAGLRANAIAQGDGKRAAETLDRLHCTTCGIKPLIAVIGGFTHVACGRVPAGTMFGLPYSVDMGCRWDVP